MMAEFYQEEESLEMRQRSIGGSAKLIPRCLLGISCGGNSERFEWES